jgi:two-component system NtrC family sensor kinase
MMFWIGLISYNNTLQQALKGVSNLSNSLHDSVYEFMDSGRQENLDGYLERARRFDDVAEIRVVRTVLLQNELGEKSVGKIKDDVDAQVLATGREVNANIIFEGKRAVRRVVPIRADRSCIVCHPDFHHDDVMAALSMTIVYQHSLDRMLKALWSIGLIQGALILFVIGAIYVLFNRLIMRPLLRIGSFVDKMGTGDLSARIKMNAVPDKGGNASGDQEDVINARDEIGTLAAAFNKMSEDLQKTMVSRDQLLKEIDERKRTEIELKAAYAQLKNAQDQLVQSEKMALVGQLAAGVAHEVNNPTAFVMCNMEVLEKYLASLSRAIEKHHETESILSQGDPQSAQKALQELKKQEEALDVAYILQDSQRLVEESLDGARRIKKIVMDLKTFSHAGHQEKELARVEDLVGSAINIVWNEIKHKVEIVKEFHDLPPLLCYPQPLIQVFLNILVNAAQAIVTRGKIVIKGYVDGPSIVLEFMDNGMGMSPEIMSHIFEPFFTTKPVGQGTGLGLSISYDIIRQHQGQISVRSVVGDGSTFMIRLPLADQGSSSLGPGQAA